MAFLIRSLVGLLLALAAALAPAADARFMALSYHEVVADNEPLTPTAVRASDLARQFAWMRANDFHPVSVDQILAARAGGPPLPPNAILLTFDDGFKDAYTRVFPLLRLFNYPAVIALVGQWMDVREGQMVDYDGKPVARSKFLSWEQVREMQASGLVEVASHSYGLHRGILANPQGNTQPATTTRLYANGRYEDDAAYLARLRHDLRDSISQHTGKAPRIIVWPYGRSNQAAQEVAGELGMPIGLTLVDGFNDAGTPQSAWKRQLIENSPSLQAFAEMLRVTWDANPARSVKVDPATWPAGEDGLSPTLDRLLSLSPNIAFVKPTIERDGREMALFPTGLRPVAADQLNHIAWQTERRAGVPVFIDLPAAWLAEPELVADLARQVNFAGLRVRAAPDSAAARRLREAAARWVWPLQIAWAPEQPPTATQWAALRPGDLMLLPAGTEHLATVPKEMARHVLFEFDASLPPETIARQMRQLEADGFRQFGVGGLPESLMGPIFPSLSLRWQPQLP
ncbi:MAG: Poly-beta-1,6-N-acetyl-D-glucosamine N-deacetylase precursor [Candidatus Accumulibacter adjunctus]|uniref:Poly-beta-1,6-N-acetyl-D-glucosamine N-deacetylase n=1 Tax=Candidatus Accumulibacter adjunctus TaxID=1454001 RepID=A0A011NX09_9PROT|nr:MAG: Poly-beta-1,6-N-acetyl-D-glucosamine N-deacetylase precursor [Candidatus Accumulibacter adjunctus]